MSLGEEPTILKGDRSGQVVHPECCPHPQKVLGNLIVTHEPWPLLCGFTEAYSYQLHLGYPQHLLIQQHTPALAGNMATDI